MRNIANQMLLVGVLFTQPVFSARDLVFPRHRWSTAAQSGTGPIVPKKPLAKTLYAIYLLRRIAISRHCERSATKEQLKRATAFLRPFDPVPAITGEVAAFFRILRAGCLLRGRPLVGSDPCSGSPEMWRLRNRNNARLKESPSGAVLKDTECPPIGRIFAI